jgi:hypothetical protein
MLIDLCRPLGATVAISAMENGRVHAVVAKGARKFGAALWRRGFPIPLAASPVQSGPYIALKTYIHNHEFCPAIHILTNTASR